MIGIIITTFLRDKCLFDCLDSIQNNWSKNYYVIIVDQGQFTKEKADFVQRFLNNCQGEYIPVEFDIGALKARNIAIKRLKELNIPYILMFADSMRFIQDYDFSKVIHFLNSDKDNFLCGFNKTNSICTWECDMKKTNCFELDIPRRPKINYNGLELQRVDLCYSEDTEVFTNKGWKFFKDLTGVEKILTRKKNGNTQWERIIETYKYLNIDNMIHLKNNNIDMLVTSNHPILYLQNNKYSYIRADNYKNVSSQTLIPRGFKWSGSSIKYFNLPSYKIPKRPNTIRKTLKIKMEDWVAFLGLYLSEGSLKKRNNQPYEIVIAQNHSKKQDKFINNILKKLPFTYHPIKKHGWLLNSIQLGKYLTRFGKCRDKFIPRNILNLNSKYLQILLNSLMFGDGSTLGNKNYYWTTSKQLADDVQEIAYKCGYNANISVYSKHNKPVYRVYFNSKKNRHVSLYGLNYHNQINIKPYCNYVYDIAVEKTHVIWLRRNGKCYWNSNCRNIFLCKTEMLYNSMYDEDRKMCDHESSFYRWQQSCYKCYYLDSILFDYTRDRNPVYKPYRDRFSQFKAQMMQKYNLSSWVKYSSDLKQKWDNERKK